MLPYESILSCASIDKKIKEKKKKRILNNDLAVLPSHDTHHNKLTSRIVSKLLMSLTTLNQALIHTPIPNLMDVIQSESMISQAFQACYSIEGCLSNHYVLSYERVGYMVGNLHQLNLLPRSPLTHSRESHL